MVLLTWGHSNPRTAKTATGLLRYCGDECVAVFDPDNVGKDIANIAHQQFSLLGTYQYNDQLTLGARVTYAGGRKLGGPVENGNTLPDYTTIDLMATYKFSEHAELQFNVNNVADTTYYDSGYRSGSPFTYVAPGREFPFNFKAKF